MVVGKTIKIKTNVKAKFKSSNKKIATVSSKGVVKGKKAGKVKITVTSKSNKKQKKVVKITVKKKQKAAATTEKPTPAPNPKPTTEQPSVVKPTTETPATEAPTTEKPTTEAPATETPTTETPTTEDPTGKKVVGIEAKYRGSKVPYDNYSITVFGVDAKVIYNDGTKENIYSYDSKMEMTVKLISVVNGLAKYEFCYGEFSTTFFVETYDTENIYPYQLNVSYKGKKISKNEKPSTEYIEASVLMNDIETESTNINKSKLNIILREDDVSESRYRYIVTYDYTFTDEKGNELFVCVFSNIYVPYE